MLAILSIAFPKPIWQAIHDSGTRHRRHSAGGCCPAHRSGGFWPTDECRREILPTGARRCGDS